MDFIDKLNFNDKGLIPAIIQDADSLKVLTLCYMNREAVEKSVSERKVYVFRRSHGRLMLKGETSGCIQTIKDILVDCADNSILFLVKQERAACHEGYFSCYYRKMTDDGNVSIEGDRVFDPKEVYKDPK